MMLAAQPHYTLPATVPTSAVVALAAAAVGVWVAVHLLWRPPRGLAGRAVRFAVCVLVGFGAMEALWQALQRGLVLATNWWLWPISLLGAVALETVVALYARERQTVSQRAGLVLAGLRMLLVALVVVMLAQPVRPWDLDKTIQRWVAVLIDTSASMHVPDTQLAPGERLRLAERLGVEGARRPFALERTAAAIARLRGDLEAQAEWLGGLRSVADAEQRAAQLAARRDAMHQAFEAARAAVVEHAQAVGEPLTSSLQLTDALRRALEATQRSLTGEVRDRLKEAAALTADASAEALDASRDQLLAAVRAAVQGLDRAAADAESSGLALDEAAYAALSAEAVKRVDTVAHRPRLALARDVLFARGPASANGAKPGSGANATTSRDDAANQDRKAAAGKNLLERLRERYAVQAYTFAAQPSEADLAAMAEAYEAGTLQDVAVADLPADQQQTDLTAVFDKVMSEMSEKRLSGILLLSDGRHNAPESVEPLVRRLGIRQVPVSSVVLGGERPPIDAGILGIDAPEAIALGDRMLVTVRAKLDGLTGKEVLVALTDGDRTIQSETVRVPTESYRARVQFADKPETAGLHRYALTIQEFDDEVLKTNNRYPLTVHVSDDRIKLLLVEGRPRWEFRYIKNLFASRDRTVHLQYVLLEPDTIAGVPAPPQVAASASRPVGEVEATALPKDETEWLKFDVIVLGDVSSDVLGPREQAILRKFVEERGGTLVAIAGPQHLPHEYAEGPLAEMLPVAVRPLDEPAGVAPEESFRLALTAEGRDSVVMRQKVGPAENLEVWHDLPAIHWRHPGTTAKEGATILAYALPPDAPAFMPRIEPDAGAADVSVDEDVLAKRRAFERDHALLAYHTVATGRVMCLAFDHTWRLRYRIGDTYHHRFWGQVLRWATADRLPAGTETVKIGTDRTRYAPGEPIRVKARLATEDFTPLVGRDDVAIDVYAGTEKVAHQVLAYVANSPGLYEAAVAALPAGVYRVELDAPAARPILERQNAETVATEFSVDPATPAEQAELAPDRGLLGRLATLTGGVVAEPSRPETVLARLGPPTEIEIEPQEYVIWNSLPMLLLAVAVATAEWLLRKKVGLA